MALRSLQAGARHLPGPFFLECPLCRLSLDLFAGIDSAQDLAFPGDRGGDTTALVM
jgi:hypothetical protein